MGAPLIWTAGLSCMPICLKLVVAKELRKKKEISSDK